MRSRLRASKTRRHRWRRVPDPGGESARATDPFQPRKIRFESRRNSFATPVVSAGRRKHARVKPNVNWFTFQSVFCLKFRLKTPTARAIRFARSLQARQKASGGSHDAASDRLAWNVDGRHLVPVG